jgi:hypothetical protein
VSLASAVWPLEIVVHLRSRLDLSRLLLDEHKAAPLVAKKLSELQAVAVASMIASAMLSAAEQAELAVIVVAVPWASEADVAKVLDAFAVAAPLAPGKRRRSQQDFTKVHHYLTARMWEAMLDGTVPSDTKLTALLGHCIHLGMRCPTEPSMKWVCSFWLVCATDPAELGRMSFFDKTLKFKQVKLHFNQYRQRALDPPVWVEQLPAKPVELLRDFPLLYRTAFPGEASPSSPEVNVELICGFDMSYSCRGGMRTPLAFGSGAGPSSAGASSSSGSGMDLERLVMGFMQGMQQSQQQMLQGMQQSQQMMLQPRPATNLAALEDRSHRQAGMLGLEPPIARQRTTPLFEEVIDSPPAKAPQDGTVLVFSPAIEPADATAAPAPAHAAAVARAPNTMDVTHAVVAVAAAAPAPPAGGDIDVLFSMLDDRKIDAKAKAAEAKAAKTAENKAAKAAAAVIAAAGEVDAKAAQAAESKAAKAAETKAAKAAAAAAAAATAAVGKVGAKAKAKAKAAAKPGKPVKAAAKHVKDVLVAEAEAECEAMGLSVADKTALSKAKASQKSGNVRRLKASDGWGCSKCRWRFDGCSQCKGKTFTGFVWNPSMKG